MRWASSASKHGISRRSVRHVIARAGLIYVQRASPPERPSDQLVFLGPDEQGRPLEVMGVELNSGQLLVIHAMQLRVKYLDQYVEATRWRRG